MTAPEIPAPAPPSVDERAFFRILFYASAGSALLLFLMLRRPWILGGGVGLTLVFALVFTALAGYASAKLWKIMKREGERPLGSVALADLMVITLGVAVFFGLYLALDPQRFTRHGVWIGGGLGLFAFFGRMEASRHRFSHPAASWFYAFAAMLLFYGRLGIGAIPLLLFLESRDVVPYGERTTVMCAVPAWIVGAALKWIVQAYKVPASNAPQP